MNEVSFASKVWGTDDESAASSGIAAYDMRDAAEFKEWLQARPSQPSTVDPSSTPLGEILHSVTRSLRAQEEGFDKTLKRVARTGDPLDGLEVQRRLSELYLSHGLAVKVIGKTTQAVETLLRLQ